jgi:hypothetical protein
MDTDMVSYIPADQKADPAVVAKLHSRGCSRASRKFLPTTCHGLRRRSCQGLDEFSGLAQSVLT